MRLMDRFDEWIMSGEGHVKSSHYASGVTECRRKQFYQWTSEHNKPSDPNTPGGLLKMRFGNATEWIVREYLTTLVCKDIEGRRLVSFDEQWAKRFEVPGLKWPISCRLDYLLHFSDGSQVGLEVKSSFGRGIAEIQHTASPKAEHLAQVYLYARFTGIQDWVLMYFGRDNGYRTEFELKYDDKGFVLVGTGKRIDIDFDTMITRLAEVEQAVESGQVPPRDFVVAIKDGALRPDGFQANKIKYKGDWQCSYCQWLQHCWASELPKYVQGNNSDMFAGKTDAEDVA